MAQISPDTLYAKVIVITQVYLGPAADRFIRRQVQNHLEKDPKELSPEDIIKLIDWIRVAISMITDNSEIIDEYIAQLVTLTTPTKRSKA